MMTKSFRSGDPSLSSNDRVVVVVAVHPGPSGPHGGAHEERHQRSRRRQPRRVLRPARDPPEHGRGVWTVAEAGRYFLSPSISIRRRPLL